MEKLTLVLAFSLWFILLRIVVIKIYAKNFVRDNGLDPNGKPWSFLPTRRRLSITFCLWLVAGVAMWIYLPRGENMFTNVYLLEVFLVCAAIELIALLLNDARPGEGLNNPRLMFWSQIMTTVMSCAVMAILFQAAFLMIEVNLMGPLGSVVFALAPLGAIVAGLNESW